MIIPTQRLVALHRYSILFYNRQMVKFFCSVFLLLVNWVNGVSGELKLVFLEKNFMETVRCGNKLLERNIRDN